MDFSGITDDICVSLGLISYEFYSPVIVSFERRREYE